MKNFLIITMVALTAFFITLPAGAETTPLSTNCIRLQNIQFKGNNHFSHHSTQASHEVLEHLSFTRTNELPE